MKIVNVIGRVLVYIALAYGLIWGVVYARTQKICISAQFEITEVTYDLKPYCAGLYMGTVVVEPLAKVVNYLNSLPQSMPLY